MALALDHDKNNPLQEIEQLTQRPTFSNPISKATFEALPKIYGRTKKKKYLPKATSQLKEGTQNDTQTGNHSHRLSLIQRYEQNKLSAKCQMSRDGKSEKRFRTQMKSFDKKYSFQLSQSKKQLCTKVKCFCQGSCRNEHNISTQRLPAIKKLKLPQIGRNVQLDEVQSQHKVSSASIDRKQGGATTSRKHFSLLDLLKGSQRKYKPILEESYQQTPNNRSGRKVQRKEVEIQFPMRMESAGVQTERESQIRIQDDLKGRTQPLDKHNNKKGERKVQTFNSHRSHLQSNLQLDSSKQKSPQQDSVADKQKLHFQQLRVKQTENALFDSESEDSRSVKSSLSSASLSQHVFQSSKQSNTMFHSLKNKQTSSVKERNSNREVKVKSNEKFIYQKKNGLFVIPEEDEYVPYLKNYQPMNQKFNIKKLVRKPDFKVVKEEEGVYFGQFKDQMKNGKGILVTDRTIFEGQYTNNVKNYGCERNIDGVYKGQFVNGIREGYGTFEWNNGEIFEGEWKNGTKNGYGIWKSPRGDYYQGGWKLNRQHGKGIYKHKISTYRGHFVQFLKEGEGEQFFVNGDKYVGSYSKGKPHGFGKYTWADGSSYQGQFESGVREGRGKWVYNNGTVYQGEFKNDFKQGFGKQTYKSGECFTGTFVKGVRQQGSMLDSRGRPVKLTRSD